MTTKAKPRQGGRGSAGKEVKRYVGKHYNNCSAKTTKLPRLAPLGLIALHRYRSKLAALEFTRELSELVDCIDHILDANEGGKND